MVDYVSTEIVQYADTDYSRIVYVSYGGRSIAINLDDIFTDYIACDPFTELYFVSSFDDDTDRLEFDLSYNLEGVYISDAIKDYVASKVNSHYSISYRTQYTVLLYISGYGNYIRYGNELVSINYTASSVLFGVGYYYVPIKCIGTAGFPDFYAYVRVPDNLLPPGLGFDDTSRTDIFFFYDLGEDLVSSSYFVYDLLFKKIGGYSLFALLFGSGFLVYVAWSVGKWVFPF